MRRLDFGDGSTFVGMVVKALDAMGFKTGPRGVTPAAPQDFDMEDATMVDAVLLPDDKAAFSVSEEGYFYRFVECSGRWDCINDITRDDDFQFALAQFIGDVGVQRYDGDEDNEVIHHAVHIARARRPERN